MSFTSTLTAGMIQPGGGSVTKLYKINEARRKGLINLGEQQIDAAYNGGSAPFYQMAGYDGRSVKQTGQSYYKQDRQGGFVPVSRPTTRRLKRGNYFLAPETKTFTGYDDKFYGDREKAYTDYAMPQVAQQYRDARAATTYGLANRGQLGSSLDRQANSQLERTSALSREAVVDNARDQSSKLRLDVEQSRAQAMQQLYQATDPSRAVASAIATSSQLRKPSSFAPIVNAFANLANTYATNQAIQGYNRQSSVYNANPQQSQQTYFAPVN